MGVALEIPSLRAPINDEASILSGRAQRQLNDLLQAQWQRGGSQLAVLTIPSLEGMPIEEYSIKVVEAWKLGTAKKDNGVLLLLAMKDRKLRIEVGQGLEGSLPDAYARRIVDNVIVPRMKRGDYDDAVMAGVLSILEKTDPEFANQEQENFQSLERQQGRAGGKLRRFSDFFALGFALLIFLISLILSAGRRRRGFLGGRGGGGWYGGGGFGGGSWGGGGGFSGGGGGFSGGGSSGSW